MILVSLPRISFRKYQIDELWRYFNAIGANDSFYDTRVIKENGDWINIGWDDAGDGGAMRSAYGFHLVVMSRFVEGLDRPFRPLPEIIDDPFGVFRGQLGEIDRGGGGVCLYAERAVDSGYIKAEDLSEAERQLCVNMQGPHRRCWCPFCKQYLLTHVEAEALADRAADWTRADIGALSSVLAPTTRLVRTIFESSDNRLDRSERRFFVARHIATIAPDIGMQVGQQYIDHRQPRIRAMAATLLLGAHARADIAPDHAQITKLLLDDPLVARAVADRIRYLPAELPAFACILFDLVRTSVNTDLVATAALALSDYGLPNTVDRGEFVAVLVDRLDRGPPGTWRDFVDHVIAQHSGP